MQKLRQKRNFAEHGETDRKDSWYWNVLLKNMGNWTKAEKAVIESRKIADLTYEFDKRIRV